MTAPAAEKYRLPLIVAAVLASLLGEATTASAEVDFSRDILPILSDKCYHCHGPDAKARKANLRFDTKEGAFRIRKGKSVLVPGNAAASELIRRSAREDDGERMPPPESNRTLTPQQIDLLRRWVDEGAKWADTGRSSRRGVCRCRAGAAGRLGAQRSRCVHPRPVWRRKDCGPSPEAPRTTWLRRVTFDLTGLPPTLAEIDAFCRGQIAERLRESRRSAAGLAALRRAHGQRLARSGSLRRHARLPDGPLSRHVAVARLGYQRVQPQPALRSIRHLATGRRSAARCDEGAAVGDRVQSSALAERGGRHRRGGVSRRLRGRSRQHVRHRASSG